MKSVSAEHEQTQRGAGEKLFPCHGAESFEAIDGHESGGQGETQSEEDEDAGVGERIFYDDERGAPEKSTEDESEVGFDGSRLRTCGGRVDGDSTRCACLRVSGRLARVMDGCNAMD